MAYFGRDSVLNSENTEIGKNRSLMNWMLNEKAQNGESISSEKKKDFATFWQHCISAPNSLSYS